MPTREPVPTSGVARAARRWHELRAEGLELSFDVGPDGPEITLRTLGGEAVRPLSPAEAVRVASGESP